ncbi:ROK family transcriptional regulator [Microbacterium sp. MYb62]|uniref:ROK family transcriptional regulator n=1 Tax=Microbacterium sp. MYb62 TaxID=1848690 RepID=UPI000CFA821F|nr:ROK family transcriptional regulator [Microbacterium sp. MYb62]PRB09215.1 hypothetical protein CQ042_19590 [Microbacterium sp. MYb62]
MPEYDSRSLTRVLHDTLVFEELCAQGPLTRAEIAERCGITKITVLDITERLQALGLIEQAGKKETGAPGPKAALYAPIASVAYGVGIELHRHSVSVEIEDMAGNTLAVHTHDEGQREVGPAALLRAVRDACALAGVDPQQCTSTIVATSGGVHRETGRPLSWEVPHWKRNLPADLGTVLGGSIELENEVNLRAIAERAVGRCREEDDFVYVALGTGIAAGIVRDGQVVSGRNGLAGELGYAVVVPGIAAGEGIAAAVSLHQILGGDAILELARSHGLDGADAVAVIVEAFGSADDPVSAAIIEEYANRVAVAASMLLAVLDPAVVVLGGDFGLAGGSVLTEMVVERLHDMYSPLLVPLPPVVASQVTEAPVRTGAMASMRNRLRTSVLEAAGYRTDTRP